MSEAPVDGDVEMAPAVDYDLHLPVRHSYLGEASETQGRTILDESVQLIPLLDTKVILMPGQIMPMTLFHPRQIGLMKKLVETTKTFGVVSSSGGKEATHGTTAEIYEFVESTDHNEVSNFVVKARGRQRFQIIKTFSTIDGTRMGVVMVLSEIRMDNFLNLIRPRCMNIAYSMLKTKLLDPAVLTAWPSWLYQQYNPEYLVSKLHNILHQFKLVFPLHPVKAPEDPSELSFWIASRLPFHSQHRRKLLQMDCCIERLRMEISILEKSLTLNCVFCNLMIGKKEDIMSMSCDGPQSVYVNPNGHIFETITMNEVSNIIPVGAPSAEFSWFPGYSWVICHCRGCFNHMGWKFAATQPSMKPNLFWCITSKSLVTKIPIQESDPTDG